VNKIFTICVLKSFPKTITLFRFIFTFFWLSWIIWLSIKILSATEQEKIGEFVMTQISEASQTFLAASFLALDALKLYGKSVWSIILLFSPFFVDFLYFLDSYLFPYVGVAVRFLEPHVTTLFAFLTPYFLKTGSFILMKFSELSWESQASLGIFSLSLFVGKYYDRRAFHFLVFPASWITWKLFSSLIGNSRVPLLLISIHIPAFFSFYALYTNKVDRGLLSYWVLFPVVYFLESEIFRFSNPLYISAGTTLIAWLLFNGFSANILDFVNQLSWSVFGSQILQVFKISQQWISQFSSQHKNLKSLVFLNSVISNISNFHQIKLTYKISAIVFLIALFAYWSFKLLQRILGFLIWPWYFYETSKISTNQMKQFYKSTMAFELIFLWYELVVLAKFPKLLNSLLAVFHLPIVFLLKISAEFIFDRGFNLILLRTNKYKNS
jgi:hypothetical protein